MSFQSLSRETRLHIARMAIEAITARRMANGQITELDRTALEEAQSIVYNILNYEHPDRVVSVEEFERAKYDNAQIKDL